MISEGANPEAGIDHRRLGKRAKSAESDASDSDSDWNLKPYFITSHLALSQLWLTSLFLCLPPSLHL